jgi:uncharacterized protein (TIGR02001 family)
MKNLKLLLVIVMCSIGMSAQALELGGSVSLGSNYIFRGMSQNAGDAAVSGEVHAVHNGFFAQVWASQVDYGTGIEMEYDLMVAKNFKLGDLTVGAAYIDYNYTSVDDFTDFEESALDVEEVGFLAQYKAITGKYYMGLDDAPDYMELGVDLFGVADVTLGEYETVGRHWMVSKTIDVEGVEVTFGYRQFYVDDAATSGADEKSAVLVLTKNF